MATGCPEATWITNYYNSQALSSSFTNDTKKKKEFIAINVGCNKGFDAVNILRMGTNDPMVSRSMWRSALPLSSMSAGVCGQENDNSEYQIIPESPKRRGRVLCVEPLPTTMDALRKALDQTGYHTKGFKLIQSAINNKNPGRVMFQKSSSESTAGDEKAAIKKKRRCRNCVNVATTKLDLLAIEEGLNNDTIIDHMLVDVEGYDFEVLKGGIQTLNRTKYLEFEYNWRGQWGDTKQEKPLFQAITMLDEIHFTCYWAGKDKLWRISGCWLEHYGGTFWSNVACVNRVLAPDLAEQMETHFLNRGLV